MAWHRPFAHEWPSDRVFPGIFPSTREDSHDALAAQCRDFRVVIIEASKNLVGVLTEPRCRPAVSARGFGELDWSRRERQGAAQPGVGRLFKQTSGANVRI